MKQIFIDNAIHNTVSNQCLNLPLYFMYPMIVYPYILCQKVYNVEDIFFSLSNLRLQLNSDFHHYNRQLDILISKEKNFYTEVPCMTNPNQRLEPFDETFQQPNIHRGKRYGKKNVHW